MTVGSPWERIAAPGTDPDRLARAVAAVGAHGHERLARLATQRSLHSHPDTGSGAILDGLLPPASRTVRETVEPVARCWTRLGVQAAVVLDPAYPDRLGEPWPTFAPPLLLAWRGQPPADGPAVAIVGARRATAYGTGVAAWLAEAAAAAGVRVVSGGAVGIDAAAHRGAAEGPGGTTVVLGCGHDVPYPRVHARPAGLFDRVLAHGGTLLGELLPRTRPLPAAVLARNRIVAGLADAVVVVEGGGRSGSLRTAGMAAERGVAVLAVPGDVRQPGSVAPHRLLAEGATPCTTPDDLLGTLGEGAAAPDEAGAGNAVSPGGLPDAVAALLARRWPRPVRLDELAEAAGTGVGGVLAAVTRAEVAGAVVRDHEGVRLRRAPPS